MFHFNSFTALQGQVEMMHEVVFALKTPTQKFWSWLLRPENIRLPQKGFGL